MELLFVEFSCGCIGTLPKPGSKVFMLYSCDHDQDAPPFQPWVISGTEARAEGLREKTWKPLTPEKLFDILDHISRTYWDGIRLQDIKRLLKD